MKRRGEREAGSMDMLLDTMCNTFGGVCFIALMVMLISCMLPKESDSQAELDSVVQAEIVSKELARLVQKRDMLKLAVEAETSFVEANSTSIVTRADVAALRAKIAAGGNDVEEYEKKRVGYLDELAKLKTTEQYSRREAARLERLLGDLREKAGNPLADRHRVVRAPRERELKGMTLINVWMHQRRLYMMDDRDSVKIINVHSENGVRMWTERLVWGRGVRIDDDFFQMGKIWSALKGRFGASTYVRIFTDTVSFDELCLFRDALIANNSLYNWIVVEGDEINFREGYDGRVQ